MTDVMGKRMSISTERISKLINGKVNNVETRSLLTMMSQEYAWIVSIVITFSSIFWLIMFTITAIIPHTSIIQNCESPNINCRMINNAMQSIYLYGPHFFIVSLVRGISWATAYDMPIMIPLFLGAGIIWIFGCISGPWPLGDFFGFGKTIFLHLSS